MTSTEQYKLARLVKRFLDVIWFVLIFAAIAWPLTVIVIGLSIPADPGQRTTDVNIFLGFKVSPVVSTDLSVEPASTGVELLSGRGDVKINNTSAQMAWYLAAAMTEIMGLIALFGLAQMRKIFASLIKGESFAQENAGHIKKIGYVFICWHIILPLLQYFGGRAVLNDVALNVQGIQLYPAFEFNIVGIFAGFALIVLSGVLHEAASIHRDQSLTI
jgi:hypothetical protein